MFRKKLTKKSVIIFGLITLFGIIIYTALKESPNPKNNLDTNNKVLLTVSVVSPVPKTIAEHIHVSGFTLPHEEIIVTTELSGIRVQKVLGHVGETVKKGQVLATLDQESLVHQVNQLQQEYNRAFDEYERIEKIKHSGAISQQILAQKLSDSQAAKARLEDIKLKLSRTSITAPQDGLIYEKNTATGDLVNPNQPLFRLARDNAVEFEAKIPETSLANIKIGQKAKITFSAHQSHSDQQTEGTVRFITPNIDNATRTGAIRIAFDTKLDSQIMGLYGQADIAIGEITGLSLPETALQQDASGYFIWTLNDKNIAERQTITLKLRTDGMIIVENINPQTKVIAKAGAFIKSGDQVNVVTGEK